MSVADTGIGIPRDRQDRIFESFEQADGSTERQYGGTGLGLAVSRKLVELHGGSLGVESEEGSGSRFYFTLPAAHENAEPLSSVMEKQVHHLANLADIPDGNTAASSIIEEAMQGRDTSTSPSVLIVDDEPVNLKVLANHLSLQNYNVTQVQNGQEALDIIEERAAQGKMFDMVLLDIMMPRMSGYEVCQRLRAKYPPDILPVLMLTAKNRVEDLVAGLEAGANDYLTKPFTKMELLARVKNQQELKELADERQRTAEERKVLEEQLRQSQKMEAIGQLAGGVAHDFNNLIQAILGYLHFAMENIRAGEDCLDEITEVKKAAERASALTSQLLAFSRRQVLNLKQVDLNEVVAGLLKMVRRIIGENIELEFIPSMDEAAIMADTAQIEQLLINLCVNARDAMPDGGRLSLVTESVTINRAFRHSHSTIDPGRYIVLTVTDTGCGMNEETREHIFEPFFTTKEQGKGTGLGLAMVYGIISQHNGSVTVFSEPGNGTSIKVYLPKISIQSEEKKEESQHAPVKGGSETLLIAEDDPAVCALAERTLLNAGYKVIAVNNGEEAISAFREHSNDIDLAILDVVMPKMSGKEAADGIHQIKPNLRVLFTSGYSADGVHTDFILDKGLRLLQKPYAPPNLLRAVREALDNDS